MADPLLTSLVASYRFEGNLNDSFSTNHGTAVGSISYPSGKLNQCYYSSASSGIASKINSVANVFSGTNSFTIAMWAKTTNGNYVFSATTDGINQFDYRVMMSINSSDIWARRTSNGDGGTGTSVSATGASFRDGNWHFIIYSYNGSAQTLLVDNSYSASASDTLNIGTCTQARIGALANGGVDAWNSLLGSIDETDIWSRVLTSDEKTRLWNNGNGIYYDSSLGAFSDYTGSTNYLKHYRRSRICGSITGV